MKTKKFLLLVVMQILVVLPLVAQELYTELEREMFGEPSELFINDIVAKPIKASTLNARDGDSINAYQAERQFIDDYLKQINPNFSAGELKVHISLSQKKSFLFEVLYKDVIVDKHKITLHQFIDTAMLITGTTLFSNDINVEPTLTLDQAVKKLQLQNNKITDESILSNKLVIYKALGGEPCLCYKIEVLICPIEHYQYYVSAVNGNVIWRSKLTRDFSSETGIANLYNWGTKNIFTSYNSSTNLYFLFNQPYNIQTYDINLSTLLRDTFNITDSDNNWTLAEFPEDTTYSMNAALVCHWGAYKAYDFFKTKFNLNGYDGNNSKLNICMNYGGESKGNRAQWIPSKNSIIIGSGVESGNKATPHFGVVDIIAHEYGHAILNYLDKELEYRGESGAINEGIADIWAACVENYLGASADEIWNIGDHRGYVIRNMANPNDVDTAKTYLQPDTYGGTYWINPDTVWDDGAIHINSGVLNYWFYLLTMGGTGVNDNQESYNVKGLGFSTSQKIVYDAITDFLEENSKFAQFRNSTIFAVVRLYGPRSNEYKQVMNAWHAVGVGEPYIDEGSINGDFGVCDGGVYSISNLHPAASLTWSVDSFTNAFNQKSPKLTIAPAGRYTTIMVNRAFTGLANPNGILSYYNGPVTLTATISYGGETYTKQKTLFVNTPLPDIQYTTRQVSGLSTNKIYKFYVNNVAVDHLNWRIEANGNVYTANGQNFIEITLPPMRPYDVIVSVTDNGGCSESNYKTLTLKGVSIVFPVLSHENPVSTNSVFYLKKSTDELDKGAIYNIQIWNEYGLVRSEKYDDATEFTISTEGMMPGIYFMRVYRNGELLSTQKLIVK